MEKQNKNKIHFFKEKKWIMARFYKKNRKHQLTENNMFIQWNKWWKGDFVSIEDERFKNAYKWIKNTIQTMTIDEITEARRNIADKTSMPSYINKIAKEKGYYVKKCSTRDHPLRISGYAIFKDKSSKKPIYGHYFELTIKQVREFLERK